MMSRVDDEIRAAWQFCFDTYPNGEMTEEKVQSKVPEVDTKSDDIKEKIMKAYWDGYYKGFRDGQNTNGNE